MKPMQDEALVEVEFDDPMFDNHRWWKGVDLSRELLLRKPKEVLRPGGECIFLNGTLLSPNWYRLDVDREPHSLRFIAQLRVDHPALPITIGRRDGIIMFLRADRGSDFGVMEYRAAGIMVGTHIRFTKGKWLDIPKGLLPRPDSYFELRGSGAAEVAKEPGAVSPMIEGLRIAWRADLEHEVCVALMRHDPGRNLVVCQVCDGTGLGGGSIIHEHDCKLADLVDSWAGSNVFRRPE